MKGEWDMYAIVDDFDKKLNLYADEEDLCYLCAKAEGCPLLTAVQNELVVLRYEKVGVDNCALYEEFRLEDMIAF